LGPSPPYMKCMSRAQEEYNMALALSLSVDEVDRSSLVESQVTPPPPYPLHLSLYLTLQGSNPPLQNLSGCCFSIGQQIFDGLLRTPREASENAQGNPQRDPNKTF